MLELIKQFYDKNIASAGPTGSAASERALQIATAALLVEMMRIDDEIKDEERQVIVQSICERFALSDEQAEAVIAMAEEQVKQATDDYQFTSLINKAFTLEQKIQVIESLWRVAFADRELDKYEEYLVRKVAGLLYVPHNAFIAAKIVPADNEVNGHGRHADGVKPEERSESSVIVSASALSKEYGRQRVVDTVTFSIPKGAFCGMLGPNGAGKTTILRMLVGHSRPNSGRLRVLGYRIPAQARAMRARTGIVPQVDNLDLDFTVTENLMIYGGYFGLSRAQIRHRIPELLADAALQEKADRRINELSGGMKRRLSIVRALINRPELLILDEPTTGLDPQIRQVIWQQLRQLQKNGLTLILTTHYMEEAERLCDRIILMDHGRILADASPHRLIADHIEPHVLEVHGPDTEAWSRTVRVDEPIRTERVGETYFYYGNNLQGLVESLDRWPRLRYSYRPANLEDVFLKMTGRELRDV